MDQQPGSRVAETGQPGKADGDGDSRQQHDNVGCCLAKPGDDLEDFPDAGVGRGGEPQDHRPVDPQGQRHARRGGQRGERDQRAGPHPS